MNGFEMIRFAIGHKISRFFLSMASNSQADWRLVGFSRDLIVRTITMETVRRASFPNRGSLTFLRGRQYLKNSELSLPGSPSSKVNES